MRHVEDVGPAAGVGIGVDALRPDVVIGREIAQPSAVFPRPPAPVAVLKLRVDQRRDARVAVPAGRRRPGGKVVKSCAARRSAERERQRGPRINVVVDPDCGRRLGALQMYMSDFSLEHVVERLHRTDSSGQLSEPYSLQRSTLLFSMSDVGPAIDPNADCVLVGNVVDQHEAEPVDCVAQAASLDQFPSSTTSDDGSRSMKPATEPKCRFWRRWSPATGPIDWKPHCALLSAAHQRTSVSEPATSNPSAPAGHAALVERVAAAGGADARSDGRTPQRRIRPHSRACREAQTAPLVTALITFRPATRTCAQPSSSTAGR